MTPVSQLGGPSRERLAWPFFDSPRSKYAATRDAFAAGTAQSVIDRAVKMLYREIQVLRIHEGATEVQKRIIGRDVRKAA